VARGDTLNFVGFEIGSENFDPFEGLGHLGPERALFDRCHKTKPVSSSAAARSKPAIHAFVRPALAAA